MTGRKFRVQPPLRRGGRRQPFFSLDRFESRHSSRCWKRRQRRTMKAVGKGLAGCYRERICIYRRRAAPCALRVYMCRGLISFRTYNADLGEKRGVRPPGPLLLFVSVFNQQCYSILVWVSDVTALGMCVRYAASRRILTGDNIAGERVTANDIRCDFYIHHVWLSQQNC